MILLVALLPASGMLHAQRSRSSMARPQTAMAFTGVTLIDMSDGRRLPGHTVVIVGNRIQAVGPDSSSLVPQGASIVDAQGKYLIPGLWDMHVHLETFDDDGINVPASIELAQELHRRFIANGVTGIREMAQRHPSGADMFRDWQREITAGARVGPRTVGPSADLTHEIEITTPEEARHVFDSLKSAGMAFVKFHDGMMEPSLYFDIAREARRVGIPLVGHTPNQVSGIEIADSGQRSVEHIAQEFRCWFKFVGTEEPDPDTVAVDQRCGLVAAAFVRNKTFIVPTLYMPAVTMAIQGQNIRAGGREPLARIVKTMHRLGVSMLAGTDMGLHTYSDQVVPCCVTHEAWLPIHEEISLLVWAGLTPLEALQAATLKPAEFFQATDSLGTIAPGKLADLVLLDKDPLLDIYNTRTIRAVVANGRYFDRSALDALDPENARAAKGYLDQHRQGSE